MIFLCWLVSVLRNSGETSPFRKLGEGGREGGREGRRETSVYYTPDEDLAT